MLPGEGPSACEPTGSYVAEVQEPPWFTTGAANAVGVDDRSVTWQIPQKSDATRRGHGFPG